jgi:outer membrane protein OmpA-like peptidoglycan-associated protein
MILASGCGGKRVSAAAPASGSALSPPALIALLPDPETAVTGKIRVSNEFGGLMVETPRAATTVTATAAPGPLKTLSEDEVQQLFGAALDALPPAPKHFTLYFEFDADTLTEESSGKIPEVLAAVKRLQVPEVVVIGHTDTMGEKKANVALGMKRAVAVRKVLVTAGIEPGMIQVASHGEADLLIKTRDNTPEPRNRRVEISVR